MEMAWDSVTIAKGVGMDDLWTAQDVADTLGLDVQTVYKKASELGGVKFARKWFFDKDIVRQKLFGEALKECVNAEQEKTERKDGRVVSASTAPRCEQKPSLRNTGRSVGTRGTVEGRDQNRGRTDNPHGLGMG